MPDTSDVSAIKATQMRDEWHECSTSEIRVILMRHEWHEYDTSATRTTRVWHEWKTFNFDNYIFLHPYIYYMASERLQAEELFHSMYYLWKCLIPMQKYVWKVHHKKAISKSYTLNCSCKCPCTFPHSYI